MRGRTLNSKTGKWSGFGHEAPALLSHPQWRSLRPTSSSRAAQIHETSDLLIPLAPPSAWTRSSTLDRHAVQEASMITANRAWSTRRRRSSRDANNDPARSFGIRSSSSPAVVVRVRARDPLRCAALASDRSQGPAPITAVSSASINAW
jgi:hypothetical protein